MRDQGRTYDKGQAGVNGWVKLWRQVFEHDLFKGDVFSHREAWIDLIAQASFEGPTIGGFVASERYLAARWKWSRKAVRCYLRALENQRMIMRSAPPTLGAQVGDHPGAHITICNYAQYQAKGPSEGPSKGPKDKKKEETSPNGEDATNAKRARTVKSLLPDDWMLPSEWRQWAERDAPGKASLISREADKFRDHWRTTAGRKADWAATWRNWWRRAVDMAPRKVETFTRPNTRTASIRDTAESLGDYTQRMIAAGLYKPGEQR